VNKDLADSRFNVENNFGLKLNLTDLRTKGRSSRAGTEYAGILGATKVCAEK
jgi:hypothetical protein